MMDALDVVRIRPAMRSRANLDRRDNTPGKSHRGCRIGRDHDHDLDLFLLDRPFGLGQTVGRDMPSMGVCEGATRVWLDGEVTIPRCDRREAANNSVQPVGDSPKGIMVE